MHLTLAEDRTFSVPRLDEGLCIFFVSHIRSDLSSFHKLGSPFPEWNSVKLCCNEQLGDPCDFQTVCSASQTLCHDDQKHSEAGIHEGLLLCNLCFSNLDPGMD